MEERSERRSSGEGEGREEIACEEERKHTSALYTLSKHIVST